MIVFTALAQALEFLATHLERQRYDVVADACGDAEDETEEASSTDESSLGREYRLTVIGMLGARHRERDLRERYKGKEFPTVGNAFKLGGHNDGHIHVDFVRVEAGWCLKKIWMCR